VGEPLFRDREVPIDELGDGRLDLGEQGGLASLFFR
jgi:hypothetical protein